MPQQEQELQQIILATDRLSEAAVARITEQLDRFENEVWKRLQAFLSRFDTQGGNFVPGERATALLAQIKKQMTGIADAKSLSDATKEFLANFDGIADNVRAIHGEQNGITVAKSLITPAKQFAVDATEFALRDANINPVFIAPVRKALFNHINFGANVQDTEKVIKALVLGADGKNGAFTQWIGQVATDAINQYEGVVNTAIARDNGLTAIRYMNSLIATSRPQCVRWVQKEWITEAELASEIQWAFDNGSGMVPETSLDTFLIYRGGYRCRHKGIPVRDIMAARNASAMPGPNPKPKATGSKAEVFTG